ncbi:MAG: PepSY-associated TM helix domain-containing protein [Rickettsiales bacterium]|nr:PepSY-associated TM helix domain-containing protein [Rickettsiales bacterium]
MRKILKTLHLYLALILCIPLILQGLTGSIMAFRSEISNAILHYKFTSSEGEIKSEDEIIAAASSVVDSDLKAAPLKMPEGKNFAKVRFTKNGEKKSIVEVVIDPVSLKILEINDPSKNFFRLIKKFHEDLFLNKIGKNFVGIFGIVMLFMALSGLVLWWPKKGNLKRALTFKFSDKGKKFHRDLHSSIGFWFMLPLLTTSVTGIYLIYFKNKESNKLWQKIHDGTVAGIYGESLIFLVGLLPLLFAITGIYLWLLKKKKVGMNN